MERLDHQRGRPERQTSGEPTEIDPGDLVLVLVFRMRAVQRRTEFENRCTQIVEVIASSSIHVAEPHDQSEQEDGQPPPEPAGAEQPASAREWAERSDETDGRAGAGGVHVAEPDDPTRRNPQAGGHERDRAGQRTAEE